MNGGKKPCCAAAAAAEMRYLVVGGHLIAISDLDQILKEAEPVMFKGEMAVRGELLRLVKIHNYVPPPAEEAYEAALYSELMSRRRNPIG